MSRVERWERHSEVPLLFLALAFLVAYAWPMLRPLRLLRLLAFARVLGRSAARNLVGQVTTYVVGTAVAAVFLGALAMLGAERHATTWSGPLRPRSPPGS